MKKSTGPTIKTIQKYKETQVDSTTGEVLDEQIIKFQMLLDETKFALVYSSLWDQIMDTNLSKADIELFGYLLNNYGESVLFTITSAIKEAVSSRTKRKPSTYNNSSKALKEANFIVEISKRSYIINPQYAFRGSTKDRKKLILELSNSKNLKISSDIPTKTF